MTKKNETILQIVVAVAVVSGMEYYFFRSPALFAEPAKATNLTAARAQVPPAAAAPPPIEREDERRLRNVRQLTDGGENAEAYWSFDGKKVVFQSTREGLKADQIFTMNADGSGVRMVSTGKGRTTCSYWMKGDERILFASTHLAGDEPPPPPDFSQGYVWPVFPSYDLFTCKPDGTDLRRFTKREGYDAEATVSPDGEKIVFTSMRHGDLELYVSDNNGNGTRRLTREVGYDGGAFFSPDGKKICYRAYHPKSEEELNEYRDLLGKNLVKPSKMELWVMDVDGGSKRQVTRNGAANFCPFFTPDGNQLIFSSNMNDPKGRNFDLFLVNLDGTGLEQVTFDPTFDGFPMFSPDGKKLLWASNRNAKQRGDTNVFVAEWVQ